VEIATEKAMYDQKVEMALKYGEQIGEALANNILTQKNAAKEFSKFMIVLALDELKKIAIIEGVKAMAKQISSKGFIGIATGAALTALITAAFEVAKAKVGSFDSGGFTGPGLYKDQTGHRVAGVVHDGEYVISKAKLQMPAVRYVANQIESMSTRKSFASGGFTSDQQKAGLSDLSLNNALDKISRTSDELIDLLRSGKIQTTITMKHLLDQQARYDEIMGK
jgi:hypothetical protein